MAIEMECICVFIRMEDILIYILTLMKINRIVVCLVNFREENLSKMLALLLPLETKKALYDVN